MFCCRHSLDDDTIPDELSRCVLEQCLLGSGLAYHVRAVCIQSCRLSTKVNDVRKRETMGDNKGCIGFLCHLTGVSLRALRKENVEPRSDHTEDGSIYRFELPSNTANLAVHSVEKATKKRNLYTNDPNLSLCEDICNYGSDKDFYTCVQKYCTDAVQRKAGINNSAKRDEEQASELVLPSKQHLTRMQKKWVGRVSCLEANCEQFKHNTDSLFQCGMTMCGDED